LALSSSLRARTLADGGLVNSIHNLFIAFIFIPFRGAALAKPFIRQTARVVYYTASSVVFTLLAVITNSSHYLPNIESYTGVNDCVGAYIGITKGATGAITVPRL